MDLTLTDEQRATLTTARDFATREVAPRARELDKQSAWPKDLVKRLGELGFMGLAVPDAHGGAGLATVSYAIAMEEVSAACASPGVIMSVNNSRNCDPVAKFGTEAQKAEFLAPYASGAKLGCFGLTEPMSGSDAATMATFAERRGDAYVINGSKNWITNGPFADTIVLFAMTTRGIGHKGASAILVPLDAPGVTRNHHDDKLGIRAAHSCTIFFENVTVPVANRLAGEGEGFKVAMATLDGGRIGFASQALRIARAAYEKAVAYSKERKSFGVPIAQHQAIQFKLADMATEIDAARLLIWRAAAMKDKGVRHSSESAQAKLYASEMATRVTHQAIQVFGGYGYSTEFDLERHYRDARITEIYEGTSEIQRMVIAASALKA
jgi:alkylation response protein AidB-like acyl-CoA dehydrogenase